MVIFSRSLVEEMSTEVAGIGDEIIQRDMVRQVAERMAVDEEAILRILKKNMRQPRRQQETPGAQSDTGPGSQTEKAEREIIKLMASGNSQVVELLRHNTNFETFSDPVMKTLADYLLKSENQNGDSNLSGALDLFQEKKERERASRLLLETTTDEDAHRVAVDCIITLEKNPLKDLIEQARIKLRDMERAGDDTSEALISVMNLRQQMNDLETKRKTLLEAVK